MQLSTILHMTNTRYRSILAILFGCLLVGCDVSSQMFMDASSHQNSSGLISNTSPYWGGMDEKYFSEDALSTAAILDSMGSSEISKKNAVKKALMECLMIFLRFCRR